MLVLGPKPGGDSFSALVLEASGVLSSSCVGWAHTGQTQSPTSQVVSCDSSKAWAGSQKPQGSRVLTHYC